MIFPTEAQRRNGFILGVLCVSVVNSFSVEGDDLLVQLRADRRFRLVRAAGDVRRTTGKGLGTARTSSVACDTTRNGSLPIGAATPRSETCIR